MRSFLPLAALLGVAFVLGCQDQSVTAPETQSTVALSIAFANGTVVSINAPEKHGVIERTDGTLYQFNIPRDLEQNSATPEVGRSVTFTIDPENSRHATNVRGGCIEPDCSV